MANILIKKFSINFKKLSFILSKTILNFRLKVKTFIEKT